MHRYTKGDLTLGLARLGIWVRCIIAPDMSIWQMSSIVEQQFTIPELMSKYRIRSSSGGSLGGILLVEIHNPHVVRRHVSGEPCFPHECFNIIPTT